MTAYDDAETSCSNCSRGLDGAELCECDDGPLCNRCCGAMHVTPPTWKWSVA